MMGDEKKKKVIKPEDEKKRIKDMAKKERMKKILTEDMMERFGPREESEPIKIPMGAGVGRVLEPKPMGKKKGGKIGKGMTKNNYKKGGMVKKHRGDGCATKGKTKGRMV